MLQLCCKEKMDPHPYWLRNTHIAIALAKEKNTDLTSKAYISKSIMENKSIGAPHMLASVDLI